MDVSARIRRTWFGATATKVERELISLKDHGTVRQSKVPAALMRRVIKNWGGCFASLGLGCGNGALAHILYHLQ
jgi:hypothetical protein